MSISYARKFSNVQSAISYAVQLKVCNILLSVSLGLKEVFIKRTKKLPSPGERKSFGLPFVNHSKTSVLNSRSLRKFSAESEVKGSAKLVAASASVQVRKGSTICNPYINSPFSSDKVLINPEIGNSLYFTLPFRKKKGYCPPMVSILLSRTVDLKLLTFGLKRIFN
jgi:hypothetical protein